MSPKTKRPNKDEILTHILALFDSKDKQRLAQKLVEEFDLNDNEVPFFLQVEKLLGRKLEEDERFKLFALERITIFHDIRSGRLSGDATTDAPPPPRPRSKR